MLHMQYDEVLTPRLALILITPAMLLSEQANDGQLAEFTHAAVPADWPPQHWEPHVFDLLLKHYERIPEQMNWHRYVALRDENGARTVIGMVGAFWKEEAPAECEIGYSILPRFEGRGLATEATRALIELIRADTRITSVVAHTFPDLSGSIRVMEKCGFSPDGDGEEPGTVRYRLRLRDA